MLNELAVALNDQIEQICPEVMEMFSDLGARIYFPSKGILSQSAEAKKMAKQFNATIGTATEGKDAMGLSCVMDQLPGFTTSDALLYAPSYGRPDLRQAWKAKILHDNPDLASVGISLPVVTNGLTHAIALAGDLFVNPGDTVLMPDMNWDNYQLNFLDRLQAKVEYFTFFEGDHLNVSAYAEAVGKVAAGEKLFTILNFPNNPSGYTPMVSEAAALAEILLSAAERGVKIVAVIDDAYYGLFYHDDCLIQSLFTKIAGKHKNLLAIKADAATKECYVWGLRVGFLTYAVAGAAEGSPIYSALEAKTAGIIRSTISNGSELSQLTVARALTNPDFYNQRAEKAAILRERCEWVVKTLADHPEYRDYFVAYPFNSGYFMCVKVLKCEAEKLRRHLLENHGTGGIAVGKHDFRIAFSCLEVEQIPVLFDTIYKACKELDC